jgi:hypothetical protein
MKKYKIASLFSGCGGLDQYKEIEPPTPREVPIPYSLLSEVQLIWLLSRVR